MNEDPDIASLTTNGHNEIKMIENRVLDIDDYLAILKRRLKPIVIAALSATTIGFLVSFTFSPEYTSRSLVLVEKQTVPAGYVKPIVTSAPIDRIITLQQQVLSRSRLEGMISRLSLVKKGRTLDEIVEEIQHKTSITDADTAAPGSAGKSNSASTLSRRSADFPGFNVNFTTDNAHDAQQICAEITSMLLAENLKMREQVALSTTDFLARQLAEAKNNLDDKDKELAAFKSRYLGQLPSDVGNNLKILEGLNSELDANTQALNRAQQDKTYTESVLTQQIAAWKSSQTSLTSETIGQRLVTLRTQLIAMQARYTEDYPEVARMKKDIAALEAKQKDLNNAGSDSLDSVGSKAEPPGILQLRQQIHQNENVIARATLEEKRLQGLIDTYQRRLTLSPQVEEQYEQFTRDNEVAHKLYDDLLMNKSESEEQTDLEHRQQGEQMRLLDPASLPDSPSFPVRWKFAAGGLGAGLGLGLTIGLWLELRDKAIRDERDVNAALELPMLTSVPWVGQLETPHAGGLRRRLGMFLD